MRWTPERDRKLWECFSGGLSLQAAADNIGVTYQSARMRGYHLDIRFANRPRPGPTIDDGLRQRWRALLPGMKTALRADVSRIMLDKTQDVAA